MYVGLWTSLEGFEREQLDRALERGARSSRARSLRSTIHLLTPSDWWTFAAAVTDAAPRAVAPHTPGPRPTRKGMAAAARRARPLFADPPVERARAPGGHRPRRPGDLRRSTPGCRSLRVPPSGTWERRRADLFELASEWIGPAPGRSTLSEATIELVRSLSVRLRPGERRRRSQQWAGIGIRAIRGRTRASSTCAAFAPRTASELVDLPRLPIPDPETPAPARFLPVWDATLLVHARRAQILPEEHRPKVFNTRTPQSMPTFIVDGRVAALALRARPDPALAVRTPVEAARRELDAEAERLAAFHR